MSEPLNKLYMRQSLTDSELEQAKKMLRELDREKLIRAATEAPVVDIRIAAVELIDDRKVLADMTYMGEYYNSRFCPVGIAAAIKLVKSAMPEYTAYDDEDEFVAVFLKDCADPEWLSALSTEELEYVFKYLSCFCPCPKSVINAIIELYRRRKEKRLIEKYASSLKTKINYNHIDRPNPRCPGNHYDNDYDFNGFCRLGKELSALSRNGRNKPE